jgi:hypothetical protein
MGLNGLANELLRLRGVLEFLRSYDVIGAAVLVLAIAVAIVTMPNRAGRVSVFSSASATRTESRISGSSAWRSPKRSSWSSASVDPDDAVFKRLGDPPDAGGARSIRKMTSARCC